MTKREFYGHEFYAWVQQQYDEARRFLKNAGRPTEETLPLIEEAKWSAKYFKQLLD